MQSVSVYLRDGVYFIVVIHGSGGSEPCIASGPVSVLPADASSQALGSAVLQALGQSSSVPWPTDWKKVTEPLLLAAKVKSWAAFAKRASCARVDRSASAISIRPSLRDKASFLDLPDKVIPMSAPSAESLGSVLSAALQA